MQEKEITYSLNSETNSRYIPINPTHLLMMTVSEVGNSCEVKKKMIIHSI